MDLPLPLGGLHRWDSGHVLQNDRHGSPQNYIASCHPSLPAVVGVVLLHVQIPLKLNCLVTEV